MPHAKPYPLAADVPANVVAHFWAQVAKGGPDDCWLWLRALDGKGYGAYCFNKRVLIVPRFAYVLHHGSVPQELSIRHTCDNPPCCNPAHLLVGTHQENMRDISERGRRRGRNWRAAFTDEQAAEIRRRASEGETGVALGRTFGVSQRTISAIIHGKTYRPIEEPTRS
jgi:hypothetical protein